MAPVEPSFIQTLQKLRSDLTLLDLQDREGLIPIGAALEQAIPDVPDEETTELVELLSLVLEGLQALYMGSAPDSERLRIAAVAALSAAEQFGQVEDSAARQQLIVMARRTLSGALGLEASPDEESDSAPISETWTLDDVATLLIRVDSTNSEELKRISSALEALSIDEDYPASVRELIAEAAKESAGLSDSGNADVDAILQTLGELLEKASCVMEDQELCATTPEAPSVEEPTPVEPEPEVVPVQAVPEPVAETEVNHSTELLPDDADPGFIRDFITECREYIEGAEAALLALETSPEDEQSVNTVFRAFHTIKGTSAFLGIVQISELAHRAESLLSRMRDHEIRCTGGYADLALRSVDMLKELLDAVEDVLAGEASYLPDGLAELMRILTNPEAKGVSGEDNQTLREPPRLGDILVAEGKAPRPNVEGVAAEKGPKPIGEAPLKAGTASLTDVAQALRTQQRLKGSDESADSSVRVRTDRLDRLIEMVGELVIAQSMVAQDGAVLNGGNYELAKKVAHAGKIVRELQDLSMSMRMVPLKASFQKMARLVRDLSRRAGKSIEFIAEGEDTEIDRNMVDIVNDPLVHMVRNAVDHGIETPEARQQGGKPASGAITLSAFHSGGNVVVEIRDDGKGLDREKIVAKAISRGLIESDKGMSDAEVFNLIFQPGFSTADQITEISGRGVGMDVVKKSVEALKGRIQISSELGKGTTFSLRFPLTLAITDGMLVKVGEERYIVPTASIHLSFRPTADSISTVSGRGELVMLRGDLMPIFRLHRLFSIEAAVEDPTRGLLVVVGEGNRRCALLVDELLGQQQVVAKALGSGIGRVKGISGGAILGDGRVGLILDTSEIIALAREAPSARVTTMQNRLVA